MEGKQVCKELRKRRVDVCCMQEVRWKCQGAHFVSTLEGRDKLWWLGNDAGSGGNIWKRWNVDERGNIWKRECLKKNDRVMAIVLT